MGWIQRIAPLVLALILVACSGGGGGGGGGSVPTPPVTSIGPAGGTVSGPNGSSVLIPPGALSQNVDIAIAQSAAGAPPLPQGVTPVSDVYAFTPHGTAFAQPATLTVPFTPSLVPSGAMLVLYKTNAQNGWEVVAGASANGGLMSGNVSSFSWVFVGAVMLTAPSIVQQPYDVETLNGGSAMFMVVASGAPLSYQWRNTDGAVISGATGPVLLLRDRNPAIHDGDCYEVEISNNAGTVTSTPGCLSVTANTYVFDPEAEGAMVTLAQEAIAAIRTIAPAEWTLTMLDPTNDPLDLSPPLGCASGGSIVGSTLDAVAVTTAAPAPLGTHQASIIYDNCVTGDGVPANGALLVDYALTPSYAEGTATLHRGGYTTRALAFGESAIAFRVHGSVQMSSSRSLIGGDTVNVRDWVVTGGTTLDGGASGPVFLVRSNTGPETLRYTVTNTVAGGVEWEIDFNDFEVGVRGENGEDEAGLFARGTVRWRIESGGAENHSGSVSIYRSLGPLDPLNPVTSVQFIARFIPVGLGGLALDTNQDCANACTQPWP